MCGQPVNVLKVASELHSIFLFLFNYHSQWNNATITTTHIPITKLQNDI